MSFEWRHMIVISYGIDQSDPLMFKETSAGCDHLTVTDHVTLYVSISYYLSARRDHEKI